MRRMSEDRLGATTKVEGPPVWEPHVQEFKKLTRSFSRDNMAILPLERVSTTLQDVRKNSETLMLTAHREIQKLKVTSGSKSSLNSFGIESSGSARRAKGKSKIRRAASESSIRRPKISRALTESPKKSNLSKQSKDTFEWFSSLGEKINSSSESTGGFAFQLPSAAEFQEQARLVHSVSSQHLERLTCSLRTKQKEAFTSAQQTLTNCQQNLQLLQISLQQSFVEGKTVMEHRLQALGEPGSPFTSGERLQDLLTRDGEHIEAASSEKSRDQEEGGAKKPWGPFQRQAQKRKENAAKQVSSSLRDDGRQITIVTTASLPWMTGTAVNPLLRAAYLARGGAKSVNLMVPWLAKSDQERVFPNDITFENPEDQEKWIKTWVQQRTGFEPEFKLTFYPGRYAPEKCSILPVGDPTAYVPDSAADVAILEEPEHLTWYHHGKRWTDKFAHVVGVVHTNYLDYARREEGGTSKEVLLRYINSWVTRVHCHKVVKLSDAVQELPRQTTEFVHGVAESFLRVGEKKAITQKEGQPRFSKGAYFLGKCVWAKGYTELVELLAQNKDTLGNVNVDCYGAGEDLQAVKETAEKRKLGLRFLGPKDHLDESLHDYRVFVNPSTSDVVATTSAEALAMGKWLVCANHPSNAFFSQFKNCLIYRTPEEFVKHMEYALSHDPEPMTKEDRARLTWEAATERFLDVTELTEKDLMPGALTAVADTAAWFTHNSLCGVEFLREAAGAGKQTRDNPDDVATYEPVMNGSGGGLFDRNLMATNK